jgi:hypothetical protein
VGTQRLCWGNEALSRKDFEMEPISLGQLAYEAYVQHSGGKSLVTGDLLPSWEELSPDVKAAWQYTGDTLKNETAKIRVSPDVMTAITRFGTRDHTVNHLTDLAAFVMELLKDGRIVAQ